MKDFDESWTSNVCILEKIQLCTISRITLDVSTNHIVSTWPLRVKPVQGCACTPSLPSCTVCFHSCLKRTCLTTSLIWPTTWPHEDVQPSNFNTIPTKSYILKTWLMKCMSPYNASTNGPYVCVCVCVCRSVVYRVGFKIRISPVRIRPYTQKNGCWHMSQK